MMGVLLALAGVAHAQGTPVLPAPPVQGDAFRPSPFADETFTVDDADADLRATARLVVGYARDPLLAFDRNTPEIAVVFLRDVATLYATGGVGLGPVRLGLTVPVYLAGSELLDPALAVVPGDAVLDVHVTPFPSRAGRPGVAVLGRIAVPLGGSTRSLGAEEVTWEAAVALDGRVGPVWIGGHLGWRGVPAVQLQGYRWDDGLVGRLGLGVQVHPRWGVAGELGTFVGVLDQVQVAAAPTEAILSASYRPPSGLEARLGVGIPVVPGSGVPAIRVLASFGFREKKPEGSRW